MKKILLIMISLAIVNTIAKHSIAQDYVKNTFMPIVIDQPFDAMMQQDIEQFDAVMAKQQVLQESRYDLSTNPSAVMISAGRKAVQKEVRVKLHGGITWEELNNMSPEEIKEKNLFPMGFRPLPHAKHTAGGQVFPDDQIDDIG